MHRLANVNAVIMSNSQAGERLEMTKWKIVSAVSCVALLFVISVRVEGQSYDSSKKSKETAESPTTKETDPHTSETSKNWVDPIIGARGVASLSPRVFFWAGSTSAALASTLISGAGVRWCRVSTETTRRTDWRLPVSACRLRQRGIYFQDRDERHKCACEV